MQSVLESLWLEVGGYCSKNRHRSPPFSWIANHGLSVLQQYPAGMTRAVLVTELELRWRNAVRRGEHAGKLKQVLSAKQLELSDILVGKLKPIDDFRCRLVSTEDENTGIDWIMHRQTSDLFEFCKYYGFDLYQDRELSMIGCRLLQGKPCLLLPTPYLLFCIDMKRAIDLKFVNELLWPKHNEFYQDVAKKVPESLQNDLPFVWLFFVKIIEISDVFQHPQNPSTRVKTILLQLHCRSDVPLEGFGTEHSRNYPNNPSGNGAGVDTSLHRTMCLILHDEQVALAKMWSVGEVLMIYRPYIALNEKEVLFGSRTEGESRHSSVYALHHEVVERPGNEMLEKAGGGVDPWALPVHLLYGSETVCCSVRAALQNAADSVVSNNGPVDLISLKKSIIEEVSSTIEPISCLGRLLGVSLNIGSEFDTENKMTRAVGVGEKRSMMQGDANPNSSIEDEDGDGGSCSLWIQALPSTMNNNINMDPMLLHIRCTHKTLNSLSAKKQVLPGQLLFLDRLLPDLWQQQQQQQAKMNKTLPCGSGLDWVKSADIICMVFESPDCTANLVGNESDDISLSSRKIRASAVSQSMTPSGAVSFGPRNPTLNESPDCSNRVINVSRLSTLLTSCTILPAVCLSSLYQKIRGTKMGEVAVVMQTQTETEDSECEEHKQCNRTGDVSSNAECAQLVAMHGCSVVIAHVIATEAADAHKWGNDSQVLKLSDGTRSISALFGSATINTSATVKRFHGHQFCFLLSRVDDLTFSKDYEFRIDAICDPVVKATGWAIVRALREI